MGATSGSTHLCCCRRVRLYACVCVFVQVSLLINVVTRQRQGPIAATDQNPSGVCCGPSLADHTPIEKLR